MVDGRRVTEGVDLVGLAGSGADRLSLLGLAADLGLPVEALNSAAEYFVGQIPDWREHLALFRSGPAGRVFRPSPTLFLLLKLRRLSERDLDDCLALVRRCQQDGLVVDTARVRSAAAALAPVDDTALTARRQRLQTAVDGTCRPSRRADWQSGRSSAFAVLRRTRRSLGRRRSDRPGYHASWSNRDTLLLPYGRPRPCNLRSDSAPGVSPRSSWR